MANTSFAMSCLALAGVCPLKEGVGVEKGLTTTIHIYTGTQKTVDGVSAKDWRGGRAAACNIIPSSTPMRPERCSQRPRSNRLAWRSACQSQMFSVMDLAFLAEKDPSIEEIDKLMNAASVGCLKGFLSNTDEELVTTDASTL